MRTLIKIIFLLGLLNPSVGYTKVDRFDLNEPQIYGRIITGYALHYTIRNSIQSIPGFRHGDRENNTWVLNRTGSWVLATATVIALSLVHDYYSVNRNEPDGFFERINGSNQLAIGLGIMFSTGIDSIFNFEF